MAHREEVSEKVFVSFEPNKQRLPATSTLAHKQAEKDYLLCSELMAVGSRVVHACSRKSSPHDSLLEISEFDASVQVAEDWLTPILLVS